MSVAISGELVSFPGPWSFLLGRSSVILVRDAELGIIANRWLYVICPLTPAQRGDKAESDSSNPPRPAGDGGQAGAVGGRG